MNVIFGNYGDPTIAVMAWAHQQAISEVIVVSVDTIWAADNWQKRVTQAEHYAKNLGFSVVRLTSCPGFADMVMDRGQFPSAKFPWCVSFLKGLPFLTWLEKHDAKSQATIILGKCRSSSPLNFDLPEYVESSEYFGGRRVWFPLYMHSESDYADLLKTSKIDILNHRSLECEPCIHSNKESFSTMNNQDIMKTAKLEKKVDNHYFSIAIEDVVKQARQSVSNNKSNKSSLFDMGCGWPFGCGE